MKRGKLNKCTSQHSFLSLRIYQTELLTYETINELPKDMETKATLLDGFVLNIYANYCIFMEMSRAIIHIQY